MEHYKELARKARMNVAEMIYKAQSSHLGSNYSAIDILTVLFEKADMKKDKVIFSKGWIAASAYYFLAAKGLIPEKDIKKFGEHPYLGLVERKVKGIHFAGGSMGYGIPAGIGFAISKKLKKEKGRIYVICSDGEMDCGTTWESLLIARKEKLDNLMVIVDKNGLQGMGTTQEVLDTGDLKEKFLLFGWQVREINGHDFSDIEGIFKHRPHPHQPVAVIAHTIKGKGWARAENNNEWHYRAPNKEHLEEIEQCLT